MRLKSDFKDYYDGLLANDEDRETLYLRRRIEVENDELTSTMGNTFYFPCVPLVYQPEEFKYFTQTIGFCGKIYGRIVLEAIHRGKRVSKVAWSIEDVDEFMEGLWSPKDLEQYYKNRWGLRASLKVYFKNCTEQVDSFKEVFEKYRAPALVFEETLKYHPTLPHRRYHLVINPKLAAYGFQKLFPPYQAYQEVRMWLSNLTSLECPIPPISNSDMIEAKGFDLKSSFRKEKKK